MISIAYDTVPRKYSSHWKKKSSTVQVKNEPISLLWLTGESPPEKKRAFCTAGGEKRGSTGHRGQRRPPTGQLPGSDSQRQRHAGEQLPTPQERWWRRQLTHGSVGEPRGGEQEQLGEIPDLVQERGASSL
jgi:hypothetical protein